ncbi:MAG: tetratricopeptide repeat protein, partial [bacterium]|nr:tetratricopeptide repeat protein [bacterium]
NNNLDPTPVDNSVKDNGSKLKPILLGLLALAVLGGIVYGATQTQNKNESGVVKLTPEERTSFEQQVKDLQTKAGVLKEDADAGSRYQVFMNLADAQYNLGNYQDAKLSLEKITAQNADNVRVWILYAKVNNQLGNKEATMSSIELAVDLDKENAKTWQEYIKLSEKDETPERIKELYTEGIRATRNNIDLVTGYAEWLEDNNDKTGAIEQWRKAGEVNPEKKAEYDERIKKLE